MTTETKPKPEPKAIKLTDRRVSHGFHSVVEKEKIKVQDPKTHQITEREVPRYYHFDQDNPVQVVQYREDWEGLLRETARVGPEMRNEPVFEVVEPGTEAPEIKSFADFEEQLSAVGLTPGDVIKVLRELQEKKQDKNDESDVPAIEPKVLKCRYCGWTTKPGAKRPTTALKAHERRCPQRPSEEPIADEEVPLETGV